MKTFTRRDSLKVGAGALAGAAMASGSPLRPAFAQEPTIDLKPEAGATLRVLRPAKFVAGDEKLWLANTEKYTQQTGVQVKVESQGWEDLRPKAAVAANVGKGPDIVFWAHDRSVHSMISGRPGQWLDIDAPLICCKQCLHLLHVIVIFYRQF